MPFLNQSNTSMCECRWHMYVYTFLCMLKCMLWSIHTIVCRWRSIRARHQQQLPHFQMHERCHFCASNILRSQDYILGESPVYVCDSLHLFNISSYSLHFTSGSTLMSLNMCRQATQVLTTLPEGRTQRWGYFGFFTVCNNVCLHHWTRALTMMLLFMPDRHRKAQHNW